MFREFAILLCAGTFVCGELHSVPDNGPTKSPTDSQDHLALPSDASYQKVEPPTNQYLPTSKPSYEVNPAVVDTINTKSAPEQNYGPANANQQTVTISASVALDPSSPEYSNILERYAPAVEPIKPYFAAPVSAKTLTVGSNEARVAHGPVAQVPHGYNVVPVIYSSNAVPQAGTKTVIESFGAVNFHPPATHGTQHVAPAVAYATNSPAPRPYYAVPLSANTVESHGAFIAHSPAVATHHFNQVQAVNPPAGQYVPAPRVTYNVNPANKPVSVSAVPVASKSVTIEAYNSVTAHPPPAPKYASVPALLRFAPAAVKPIPVPVIYNGVETHHASAQQFPVAPPSAAQVQAPVGTQPIIVPVYPGGNGVKYHPVAIPVGPQKGYATALVFSPASEVSSVTFNGLGVSYGW